MVSARHQFEGHRVAVLVGPRAALRAVAMVVPAARVLALTPGSSVFALPLTDEVHEGLHRANGTGEWIEFTAAAERPLLTTTDIAFAARVSRGTALAWIATSFADEAGWQAAAVWIDGMVAMKPTLLEFQKTRALPLAPVNTALRMLGVAAAGSGPGQDEFATFGFSRFHTNDEILDHGVAIPV